MIPQKFYPLTKNELIKLSGRLTETEIVIYLYLMAANPFGNRVLAKPDRFMKAGAKRYYKRNARAFNVTVTGEEVSE